MKYLDLTAAEQHRLSADTTLIADFVAKVARHDEKLAAHKAHGGDFPRPIGKDAKWPAYGAAHRLEKALGLDSHASSVADLATVVGQAIAYRNGR